MALLERHRNIVYNAFKPMLGEEVTEAVLSYFPARDVEEPVTKEHLDLRFAEQNAEMVRLIAEQSEKLFHQMLTLAGISLTVIALLFAAFTWLFATLH